jgi:ribosomal protein S18 acetylase RimI-like enzyme
MKTTIAFKKCSRKDINTLYEIEEEMRSCSLYAAVTNKPDFEEFMKNDVSFLILRDNKIAGYCAYKINSDNLAEIHVLAILEEFRHQGLGTAALEMMLKKLKNYKQFMITTHPQNNNALQLYFKFGFVTKERKENYFENQPRLILYKEN